MATLFRVSAFMCLAFIGAVKAAAITDTYYPGQGLRVEVKGYYVRETIPVGGTDKGKIQWDVSVTITNTSSSSMVVKFRDGTSGSYSFPQLAPGESKQVVRRAPFSSYLVNGQPVAADVKRPDTCQVDSIAAGPSAAASDFIYVWKYTSMEETSTERWFYYDYGELHEDGSFVFIRSGSVYDYIPFEQEKLLYYYFALGKYMVESPVRPSKPWLIVTGQHPDWNDLSSNTDYFSVQVANTSLTPTQGAILRNAALVRTQLKKLIKAGPNANPALKKKLAKLLSALLKQIKAQQSMSSAPALHYPLIRTTTRAIKLLKGGKVVQARICIVQVIAKAKSIWAN